MPAATRLISAFLICAGSACLDAAPASPDRLILGERLVYTLDWDRAGIELAPGGGWRAVNALGFEFELAQGYLTTNRMELLPCDWGEDRDGGVLDVVSEALGWLTGKRALAGHGEDAPNPTRVLNFAEPLHAARVLAYSTHETEPVAYCQFSFASARADVATVDKPEEPSISGQSLRMLGRWRAGSQAAWQVFDWSTPLPRGAFYTLRFDQPDLAARDDLVEVTVRRPLAFLFDALDPELDSPQVLANKALANLVNGLRVELRTAGAAWRTDGPI